eukprot:TRINITY_DN13372_c0_g1_i1.p1 TRINITY_DN13372_c0_g1~~TRINITY_DN13372_c0_g1_i1.p1  ORF type:complete len:295 (+),score=101.37 TRINITY_DN13372_c0_g1_i1:18-902(+)
MALEFGPEERQRALEVAVRVARDAGATILSAFHGTYEAKGIMFKGSVDLVTQVDKDVEEFVFGALREAYPEHHFLGEESAAEAGAPAQLSQHPTWVVDPIDGTTNFVHKLPMSAVSIALVVNRQPVVGVVFNPMVDELFTATRGGGAFLNNKPIHVSECASIDQAVIATNVGYTRSDPGIEFMLENIRRILKANVRSLRMEGSSALELCSVAVGRLDAFYEFGIQAWDIAAATLIVKEAGGVVVDPETANKSENAAPSSHPDLDLTARRVLGANNALAVRLSGLFVLPEPGLIK